MKRLLALLLASVLLGSALGALRGAGFAQGAVTSGIIRCFDPAEYERAEKLAAGALDVTEELAREVGELYYERLAFSEKG